MSRGPESASLLKKLNQAGGAGLSQSQVGQQFDELGVLLALGYVESRLPCGCNRQTVWGAVRSGFMIAIFGHSHGLWHYFITELGEFKAQD